MQNHKHQQYYYPHLLYLHNLLNQWCQLRNTAYKDSSQYDTVYVLGGLEAHSQLQAVVANDLIWLAWNVLYFETL